MAKVLLVEDDARLSEPLVRWLTGDGHVVELAENGEDALQMLSAYRFDIIVLDWCLPGISGMDVLQKYRGDGGMTPIIFLTGRNDLQSKKSGLHGGADDYLAKPFDSEELSARIAAILRRPQGLLPTKLTCANVAIELETKKVFLDGQPIHLGKREYALLEFLMRHPNQCFSSQDLISKVWPSETDSTEDAVRSCVKHLRSKLSSPDGTCIISRVHGSGYTVSAE